MYLTFCVTVLLKQALKMSNATVDKTPVALIFDYYNNVNATIK